MTDPTAAGCTGTYSGASSLPGGFSTVTACFTDPTATSCTGTYSASSTLPGSLANKATVGYHA